MCEALQQVHAALRVVCLSPSPTMLSLFTAILPHAGVPEAWGQCGNLSEDTTPRQGPGASEKPCWRRYRQGPGVLGGADIQVHFNVLAALITDAPTFAKVGSTLLARGVSFCVFSTVIECSMLLLHCC